MPRDNSPDLIEINYCGGKQGRVLMVCWKSCFAHQIAAFGHIRLAGDIETIFYPGDSGHESSDL